LKEYLCFLFGETDHCEEGHIVHSPLLVSAQRKEGKRAKKKKKNKKKKKKNQTKPNQTKPNQRPKTKDQSQKRQKYSCLMLPSSMVTTINTSFGENSRRIKGLPANLADKALAVPDDGPWAVNLFWCLLRVYLFCV